MTNGLARAAVAVVLCVLAACGGPESSAPAPSGTVTSFPRPSASPSTGAASPTDTPRYNRYVALGDSYTAAPFVSAGSVHDPCVRSDVNYPHLLARALGVRLVDRSCTGADILNLTRGQLLRSGKAAPQIRAVSARTDLVTVGIGGNPAAAQAWFDICPALRDEDPHGSPCRDHFNPPGNGEDVLTRLLHEERRQLRSLLEVLHQRAPAARVLVVGYPAIFPDKGSCPGVLTLADGDVVYARETLQRLNRMLDRTAAAGQADYVDVYAATQGHDICSDDPWIQGRKDEIGVALAYHPRAEEQRAVADLLLRHLR